MLLRSNVYKVLGGLLLVALAVVVLMGPQLREKPEPRALIVLLSDMRSGSVQASKAARDSDSVTPTGSIDGASSTHLITLCTLAHRRSHRLRQTLTNSHLA